MGKQRKTDVELSSNYRGIKINGKKVDTHRHLMEELLGRKLTSDEVVHHKDGNKLNNAPDNLVVMIRSEHTKLHMPHLHNISELTIDAIRKNTKSAWDRGVYDHLRKPVVSFDKNSGKLIKIYKSAQEAVADGFSSGHIGSCCTGRRKSHKGRVWKYLCDCTDLN